MSTKINLARSVTALAMRKGICVPQPEEVETYLQRFPELCPHLLVLLPLAKASLGYDAELALEMFVSQESDDCYLSLLVRQEVYSPSLMPRIRDFSDKHCEFLVRSEGWFHVTTDFQKPHK